MGVTYRNACYAYAISDGTACEHQRRYVPAEGMIDDEGRHNYRLLVATHLDLTPTTTSQNTGRMSDKWNPSYPAAASDHYSASVDPTRKRWFAEVRRRANMARGRPTYVYTGLPIDMCRSGSQMRRRVYYLWCRSPTLINFSLPSLYP